MQKTSYEMRISDWSSDVCSSDLIGLPQLLNLGVVLGFISHRLLLELGHFALALSLAKLAIGLHLGHCGLCLLHFRFSQRLIRLGKVITFTVLLSHASRHLGGSVNELINRAVKFARSEEHTSELQSLMRISYAVFCLKKKKNNNIIYDKTLNNKTDR